MYIIKCHQERVAIMVLSTLFKILEKVNIYKKKKTARETVNLKVKLMKNKTKIIESTHTKILRHLL